MTSMFPYGASAEADNSCVLVTCGPDEHAAITKPNNSKQPCRKRINLTVNSSIKKGDSNRL